MVGGWSTVPDDRCYGIAIYNFSSYEDQKLSLNVGETVHILEENEGWYYGCCTCNPSIEGMFPCSYVHITECTVDKSGPGAPIVLPKQPSIVHELTTVLREWGTHWKHLYVTHRKEFEEMKNRMYDLIKYRSKIISGTLPVDELKRISKQVISEIDMGNKILGLDMIVRDKDGNLLNADETSTLKLYYLHKNAAERIKEKRNKIEHKDVPIRTAIQQYSHIFVVAVKNFTCKMTEDAELIMTLYDAKENRAITENYIVRWSKDGLMSDLDQMYTLRVMFTDLGKRDLERDRIFLVCYVVRIGAMDTKETDHNHRRSSTMVGTTLKKHNSSLNYGGGSFDTMRRPFGVAALHVTPFLKGHIESDLEQEYPVPFYNCDKDNLEQTLKKFTNREYAKHETKNQALYVSLKLLHGDLKQVSEENPHLVLGNISIARKMGFPEVILPGDVRNDLYLTLNCGEFAKGNKTSDKNVEVVVKVCNEKGVAIPGVISSGSGISLLNEYRSVIYYHEDKPQWYETFKIAVPIEEFRNSHLKFVFKHRSSNEAKDKSEKPFAMSYVKLMQENGTTLRDSRHNLVVYKIDYKKLDENGLDYFKLPSTLEEIRDGQKPQAAGLSFSTKDSFSISTNVCSTKLTQNVDLLGLLNWATHKDTLKESLQALMKVDAEEVVKFLQDILDALFSILMDNPESDKYDEYVFDCLLHIISLVSNDWKYQHFEPVLDLYIKESFSATLAYNKLIVVIKNLVDNAISIVSIATDNIVFKAMKSLQYIMRFVVRSRLLFCELYPDVIEDDNFEEHLNGLLQSIVTMMCQTSDTLLREQGACLKYLPSTIPDILKVFNRKTLSNILCDLLKNIPANRLTKQKMMTVNEIVHSQIFAYSECRKILLPIFTRQIKNLLETCEEGAGLGRQEGHRQFGSVAKVARVLGATQHCLNQHRGYPEEVELCIKILSDILDLLFQSKGSTVHDIAEIMSVDLRTVTQVHINMDKENPYAGNLVAIMIDIFRQMTNYHYEQYIASFAMPSDILDFVTEILLVFKELVSRSVFLADWCDMIMLQNYVILKCLRCFSHTIRDHFFEKFDNQAWSNFFHCAIAFMTQPALQLETFSYNKRMRILRRYKDMRLEMGCEIRSMWFNLGQYKTQFVPSLVGSILEMTLIPERELRVATIPIFFDMMQCEFYSSRFEIESYGDTKRDSSHIKGSFCDVENEMIAKLDILLEGGRGDEQFKNLFHDIMMELCSKHTTMKDEGIKFVKMVTRLMERLLEYRCIITDENKENRMSCTVNLLDFYSEISRKEMYIRYVNKLCDLHLECDNFAEAAYTLQLHSNLLNWSDEPLPLLLKSVRHGEATYHRQLKEALYYNIIDYFDKGKMWEFALQKCEELVARYKETFDYEQLSELHKRMSVFYEDIMRKVRAQPEYFRVAYYGRGFPAFLQNKIFIYRGKEYERLTEFSTRILNEYPQATLMNKLTPPGEDILESYSQYIQINHVEPVMDPKRQRFSGKPVADQIVKYYKVNDVQKFQYSRPFTRKDAAFEQRENEFANLWLERTVLVTTYPLPGILRWFPVSSTSVEEISPLNVAIETMEQKNRELRDLILVYDRDKSVPINNLSLKLNGIVDPAVMGGITNYEEAFFVPEYVANRPDDYVLIQRLKDLIADQIPLLELGVQMHRDRAPMALQPFQKRLEDCFAKMKENVIEKYGKRQCDLKLEVTMRRQSSIPASLSTRVTTDSPHSSDSAGNRSRVPSLTRSQVASLKQFTSTFNFSTSSTPALHSKLVLHNVSKSSLLSPARGVSSSSTITKMRNKTPKEKRRANSKADTSSGSGTTTASATSSSSSSGIGGSAGGTQWYTSETDLIVATFNGAPVFELRQELTSKRPLRSEVERERRNSRPPSGQFSTSRPNSMTAVTVRTTSSSGNSSNRDSVGTTDSSVSEEDLVPPPLPAKARSDADCSNNSSTVVCENTSFLYSYRNSLSGRGSVLSTARASSAASNANDDDPPPTPPPKPPKIRLFSVGGGGGNNNNVNKS